MSERKDTKDDSRKRIRDYQYPKSMSHILSSTDPPSLTIISVWGWWHLGGGGCQVGGTGESPAADSFHARLEYVTPCRFSIRTGRYGSPLGRS